MRKLLFSSGSDMNDIPANERRVIKNSYFLYPFPLRRELPKNEKRGRTMNVNNRKQHIDTLIVSQFIACQLSRAQRRQLHFQSRLQLVRFPRSTPAIAANEIMTRGERKKFLGHVLFQREWHKQTLIYPFSK